MQKKERLLFGFLSIYRFLSMRTAMAIAMIMAMPVPSVYISYGGFADTAFVGTGVGEAAALLTVA
jgi:hypothetical protein